MSLPSDDAVKKYVGSWEAWMRSVGVSWDDATELEYDPSIDEEPTCEDCKHSKEHPVYDSLWCEVWRCEVACLEPACEKFEPKEKEASKDG